MTTASRLTGPALPARAPTRPLRDQLQPTARQPGWLSRLWARLPRLKAGDGLVSRAIGLL